MPRPSDTPLVFADLDELDAALVLAKALSPGLERKMTWINQTVVLLRGATASAQGNARYPAALKGKHADERVEKLRRQGWVMQRDRWGQPEFGMPLERVFEVLHAAHAAGHLEAALERAWGTRARRYPTESWPSHSGALGRARALLVAGQLEEAMRFLSVHHVFHSGGERLLEEKMGSPLRLFGFEPEPTWLSIVPDEVLVNYAKAVGLWCSMWLGPLTSERFAILRAELERRSLTPAQRYPVELLRAAVLALPAEESAPLVEVRGKAVARKLAVLHAFVRGDLEATFAAGCEAVDRSAKRRGGFGGLGGLEGIAYMLACLDAGRREVPDAWLRFRGAVEDDRFRPAAELIEAVYMLDLIGSVEAGRSDAERIYVQLRDDFDEEALAPWPKVLVGGLLSRWFDLDRFDELESALQVAADQAARRLSTPMIPATFAALVGRKAAATTLLDVYRPRPVWMHVVEQFEALADDIAPPPAKGPDGDFRPHIFWEVSGPVGATDDLRAAPRLVSSPRAPGGREISFREVLGKFAEFSDAHDRAAASQRMHLVAVIESERGYLGGDPQERELLARTLLLGLVDHPRVVREDGTPIRIAEGAPRVVIDGDEHGAHIFVEPKGLYELPIALEWDGPDRLLVCERDITTEKVMHALLGTAGGRVPAEALARLRPALTRLVGHLEIEGRGSIDLQGERVDPRVSIDVDLQWRDPTLAVHVGVRPLGPEGPWCVAARGQAEVIADIDGTLRSTTRDLAAEEAQLSALLEACPRLGELEVDHDGARFATGLDAACQVLEELTAAASAGLVSLGWPRGQALRLSREYGSSDFRIRVLPGRPNWLALEAGVEVEEGDVLAWRLLAEHRSGSGQYVRLDDDRVLKLSEGLRRKLDAIQRLDAGAGLDEGAGGVEATAAVPELALPALTELLGEGGDGLHLVGEVAERQRAIEAALAAQPRKPRGLKAKLRDYQREGYRWMSRLAQAGLGAVLADDMGLGKTIQTLALLLARREEGPALVVCPTSVTANWCAEAARFAPSLELVTLGDVSPEERLEVLQELGPGQVGVMSYGLLSRMEGEVEGLRFASLIFDEAHALKNSSASRTQAAAGIEAEFRLGLTGTPIENHLGELWSVMNVCVPGLLGDEEWFSRGLARAIEEGSDAAADHLRALIRPFLLRRTKEMVLTELPERTESTVMVEPSRRERAWYEAQRRLAQEKVAEAAQQQKGLKRGQARIQVLAEIGRLRRAAVDPRLIDEQAPRGAKLDLVVSRAVDLVESGHRVLVFTQFLDVIRMLDGRLRKKGVRTLELQGSTPAKERARRIAAFQAGEADVFLMSLKAGGVGVNLTAADYVLHVDPWWNPAVEDQATGRAHRMGQTRPVTVYRFCTEGTIEPKILALHDRKRELAEDLLSGMAKNKKLDLDELRSLMSAG